MMSSKGGARKRAWFSLVGAVALGVMVMTVTPASADEGTMNASKNVALEVSSWLLTAPYGAFKAAYALGGTAVGGFVWLVTAGDTAVAKSVWTPAITGDYIVRPENLSGQKPINFVGKDS
ncbi:MAG: hypothetical protein OEY86_05405 [Nitrospira sp.]|nr:hypothetical protein [Nitrospira sp.]